MGRGFIRFLMPASGRTEFVAYSAFLSYRLPNGTELPVDQQVAWCPACVSFTIAERLPSVTELELSLSEVRSADPARLRWLAFLDRSPDDEADEITRRIAWSRGRRSSPRCLECGCDRILLLPEGDAFGHPATGEPVEVVGTGWASMARWVAKFTPEGVEIARPESHSEN